MPAPSLGEILSVRGDAALGINDTGADAVQIAPDSSLPYLQAAAQANSQADKYVYEQHQASINNALKSVSDIDTKGILDNDRKDLTSKYGTLLKNIYQNFDVIKNPQRNLDKAIEIKQAEADLRSQIEQSKSQNLVVGKTRDFLQTHPNWNTTANKAKLDQFLAAPSAERQVFDLDAPFNADITALAKAANAAAEVKTADSVLDKTGKYIVSSTGSHIDPVKYEQNILAQLNGNDDFGNSLKAGFQDTFNRLPDGEKQKYTDVNDFVIKNAQAYMGLPQTTASKRDENQFALQSQSQRFQAGENAKNRAIQLQELALKKESLGVGKGTVPPLEAGAYKVQLLTNALATGDVPLDVLQKIYGSEKKIKATTYPLVAETEITDGVKKTVMKPDKEAGKIEEDMSKLEVVGSSLSKDKTSFVIKMKDNSTGKTYDVNKSAAQLDNDFNNVLGSAKAATLADGSRRYLKDKTGSDQFDIEKTKPLFGFGQSKPVSSVAGYTSQRKVKDSSGAMINAGVKNNKWYNLDTGKELK